MSMNNLSLEILRELYASYLDGDNFFCKKFDTATQDGRKEMRRYTDAVSYLSEKHYVESFPMYGSVQLRLSSGGIDFMSGDASSLIHPAIHQAPGSVYVAGNVGAVSVDNSQHLSQEQLELVRSLISELKSPGIDKVAASEKIFKFLGKCGIEIAAGGIGNIVSALLTTALGIM